MTLTHDDPPPSQAREVHVPLPRRSPARRRDLRRARGDASGPPARAAHSRAGSPRTRHRTPVPSLRWRVLVATAGALLLVACSGMALGIVTISPSGLGLDLGAVPQGPPEVAGTDGVYPGGPARTVSLTVRNAAAAAFEITAVTAELAGLPADCPAAAWRVGAPELLPTVPARAEVTVPLPVALAPDAPDSCQAMTVRIPVVLDGLRHPLPGAGPATPGDTPGAAEVTPSAGAAQGLRPERLEAVAPVTTALLGSPGGTLSVRGTEVAVQPAPPAAGPVPARYDVEVLGARNRRTAVCTGVTGPCLDRTSPAAADRRYVVTARAGVNWRRSSSVLQAWTPPPAPSVDFADGGPSAGALVIRARGAASAYDVAVYADGWTSPFHTSRVLPGGSLDVTVPVPDLGPGTHRFVAVSRFHGWRAPSGTLRMAVAPDGVASPQPSEQPAPVTSEPAQAPSATAGPPIATLPTTRTPGSTRTTGTTAATTRRRTTVSSPTANPAGPPAESIPAQGTGRSPDPVQTDPPPVEAPVEAPVVARNTGGAAPSPAAIPVAQLPG